jgi:hypothetical protein
VDGRTRGVNGSDRILPLPYPLSCVFVGFGAERIVIGCGFGNGFIRWRIQNGNRTDSERKQN